MKYFGKKSVSSFMYLLVTICWILGIAAAVIGPLGITAAIWFSTPEGSAFIEQNCSEKSVKQCKVSAQPKECDSLFAEMKEWKEHRGERDWEIFKKVPLGIKLLILPYFMLVIILKLILLKHLRMLFRNFTEEKIFCSANAESLKSIGKFSLIIAAATFSAASAAAGVLILLLCEIFKNGSVLQEEHDLTV